MFQAQADPNGAEGGAASSQEEVLRHECELVTPKLARLADPAGAGLSGRSGARPRRGDPAPLSAAGVRRRGAAARRAARRGRRGQGVSAAGRRLRRKLRRVPPEQHPRHLQGAAADGGGADLWRRLPGGQGGPDGRPVRQAALVRHRNPERRHPALLSRRHHQRHRFRRRRARARSAAHDPGLQPVGRDVEPAARLRPGRLCRSAPGPWLEPGFRRRQPAGRALPRSWPTG